MRSNHRVVLPLILNLLVEASFIPSIYYAYINEFWPMLYLGTIMFLTKTWYADRVALQYGNITDEN